MKKVILLALAVSMLMLSGCQTAANLVLPEEEAKESTTPMSVEPSIKGTEDKPTKKIVKTKTLNMTNEWTIIGDYNTKITASGGNDRIVLATSAQSVNGEMQWDDAQYWTLAVVAKNGAYNLFNERISGQVYAEVSEGYVQGIPTKVISLYIFSGSDREIRNYVYSKKEDAFFEQSVYSSRAFSTGGISNLYSTVPESKAR